jgi:trans-4-hydroxy-L-proline dehydratase
MTDRIKNLRVGSNTSLNHISEERALLITRFYKCNSDKNRSIPEMRAKAFEYLLENKKIVIIPEELIVGERGPKPKATPTYPEVSLHSLHDLEVLHKRPKVSFKVSEKTYAIYRDEIIPWWQGKSNREKIFAAMDENWKVAYYSGVFTEFQEQRAPGHTVAGGKIYQKGLRELQDEIELQIELISQKESSDSIQRINQLKAMHIAAEAMINYARRHAIMLSDLAASETDKNRKSELLRMVDICNKVPAEKPETFHEALQHYWFLHLGVITELNPWDSFNPGRLDQHLYPFYKREIDDGKLTKEYAIELLEAFWIKFNNHPAPPKVGVTALESNTYTDFTLINLGGLKEDGSNAVNELSFIILDVIEEMRLLQPGSMVQVSRINPDSFLHRAIKITKTGFGQPSIFNTDAIVEELTRQGKSPTDARNGGASGCVEAGAFGTEAYFLTGYFNLAKILELTLNNGFDPKSQRQLGPATGKFSDFETYHQFLEAYEKQIAYFVNIKIKGNRIIERLFAENLPVPFLSLIIDDCIADARDYNDGGARYNTSYIQGVGLGSCTDSLAAIKYHVFDKRKVEKDEFLSALNNNFNGFESLRFELIYETPKYGNDDDYADNEAVSLFEMFFNAVDGKPNARGGKHHINLLPTTCHVYFGSVTGALPDGRKAGEPLSEGISPVQGADTNGPTAVLKSASKFDHLRTGGTLLNQKFTPAFFRNDDSIRKIGYLIRAYFKMNGHHIQFNVVTAATLKAAQRNPEKYRDLIVRVAGYSDYFNDLGEDLQNEIIRRTEHSNG